MIVVVTENVPNRLRGYLARWFVEVRAGVFIGDYNVKIRERIWLVIRDNLSLIHISEPTRPY